MKKRVNHEIEVATDRAESEPLPVAESALDHVFVDGKGS
jgi:hypothetical protein